MRADRADLRWTPLAAILVLAWLALFPITSVDAYYHLATGRRILDEGAIPTRGVGSATFGEAPWHDNEWGFQVLAALVGRTARDADGVVVLTPLGRAGLVLLRALCLAATLALLSAQMARLGVEPLTRAVALMLAGFLTFGNLFWDVRPQILSYLALAATGYLLERDRGGARWAAPAILGVVTLWANVHGAFVIGVALVGAEGAGEMIEGLVHRGEGGPAKRRGARLLVLAALAPLAACLNPHGWRQVVHPLLYMVRPEIHEANLEWERPDLLHLPLFLLTVALLVVSLLARRRARLAELLRAGAFLALFLTAIRHLPLVVLVLVPIVASAISGAARRGGAWRNLEPTGPRFGKPAVRLAAAALLVVAIVALSGARFIGPIPRFEERAAWPMPEREVRFLAREGVEGNGFNAYRFGGFLMFRLYPAERVFMDGRNDLYGAFRASVYDVILDARPGWQEAWDRAVERYRIGWVLVDSKDPLVAGLREKGGWLEPAASAGERDPGTGIALLLRDTPANRGRVRAAQAPGGAPGGGAP